MRVIDEGAKRSRQKVVNLSFEDFLEALVRCATMKSTPTEEDVSEAGYADAGEFVLELKAAAKWDNFCDAHPQSWDTPLRQPIEKCVDALIVLVIRTIEQGTRGSDNLQLTVDEVKSFIGVGK